MTCQCMCHSGWQRHPDLMTKQASQQGYASSARLFIIISKGLQNRWSHFDIIMRMGNLVFNCLLNVDDVVLVASTTYYVLQC